MAFLKTAGDFMFRVKRTNKTIRENDKGNLYVYLPLEVAEGPHAGEECDWKGYLNGGAFDITCKNIERTFFKGELFSDFFGLDEGRVSLVDRVVPGVAGFEEYQGKQYLRVNFHSEDAKASENKLGLLQKQAEERAKTADENAKVAIQEDAGSADLPF